MDRIDHVLVVRQIAISELARLAVFGHLFGHLLDARGDLLELFIGDAVLLADSVGGRVFPVQANLIHVLPLHRKQR